MSFYVLDVGDVRVNSPKKLLLLNLGGFGDWSDGASILVDGGFSYDPPYFVTVSFSLCKERVGSVKVNRFLVCKNTFKKKKKCNSWIKIYFSYHPCKDV